MADPTNNEEYITALKEQQDAHTKEVEDLKAAHTKEVEDLKAAHTKEVEDLKAAHIQEIKNIVMGATQPKPPKPGDDLIERLIKKYAR